MHDLFLPIKDAPKDGSMLLLLCEFEEGALEDSEELQVTIGFNQLADIGEDIWQIAGWDWCHDCFTTAIAKPIGYLPYPKAAL